MKKICFALAALAVFAACNKEVPTSSVQGPAEVVFKIENSLDFAVQTRAAAVTSLTTFNVVAEDSDSQSEVWSVATTQSGSNYNTGKYWPSVDGKYAFYAANTTLAYAAGGATVSPADNELDVVVAYSPYSSANYKNTVALTFEHIYARIGDVTINAPEGYSIAVSSISTAISKGGTYNLQSAGWTSKSVEAAQALVEGANDVYAVPATYDVTVVYTLTKGDFVQEFTKTGSVTLVQGKVNSISATPVVSSDEEAQDIVFTVTLTPWGSQNHDISLN